MEEEGSGMFALLPSGCTSAAALSTRVHSARQIIYGRIGQSTLTATFAAHVDRSASSSPSSRRHRPVVNSCSKVQ